MSAPDTLASVNQLAWLGDVRAALLRLHKTLLDSEKLRYEKTHGRINGGLAFLQLAANDPWFAWIRPIGSLIVEIDERLDAKTPMLAADVFELRDQARAITTADPEGTQAQREYDDSIQASPEVLIAHVSTLRVLGRAPSA
jgi:hypothetical protein